MTTPQWPTVGPDEQEPAPYQGYQHPPPGYQHPPGYQQPPGQSYPAYPAYPQQGPSPGPPAPPKPPPHRWGFGAFFLAEAVFLLTSVIVPLVAVLPYTLRDPNAITDDGPVPGPVLVAALSIPPLVAALVALLTTRVRGNGPIVDLRLRFGWRDVGIGVGCGVVGVFLTIPLGLLWAHWVGEDDANSAVGEVFEGIQMPLALAIIVFLDVWLLAPICEEIIFRGLLWGAMERREWNRWVILAITSVVFAFAHFEPQRAPLLIAIGLPIGVARLLSGRLAAPVIAHQINNFLPALALTALLLGHPLDAG